MLKVVKGEIDKYTRKRTALIQDIRSDPFLKTLFVNKHPFFVFEIVSAYQVLNFRVGFRHQEETVYGSIYLADFDEMAIGRSEAERRFSVYFRSIIRALLVENTHQATARLREGIQVYGDDGMDWGQVSRFLHLCTNNLQFVECGYNPDGNVFEWGVNPKKGGEPFVISFPKVYLENTAREFDETLIDREAVNDALKECLVLELCRGFFDIHKAMANAV